MSLSNRSGLAAPPFQTYRPLGLPGRDVSKSAPTLGSYQNTPLTDAVRISDGLESPFRHRRNFWLLFVITPAITVPSGATNRAGTTERLLEKPLNAAPTKVSPSIRSPGEKTFSVGSPGR